MSIARQRDQEGLGLGAEVARWVSLSAAAAACNLRDLPGARRSLWRACSCGDGFRETWIARLFW